jgi:putative hydrolase
VIDWKLANTVAEGIANLKPAPEAAAFEHVAGPTEESARLVSAYTGLMADVLPHAEPVDRPLWIQGNLSSLKTVLDPVADKLGQGMGPLSGAVSAASGALLAVEVGAVSGMLAQRVLGQYEFPILEPEAPARLLFVSPNLAVAAGALKADPDELLRWVALHEVTHALQFGGVPWLRPHIASMVRELLGGLQVDPVRLMKLPDTSDFRSIVDKIREGDLATLIVGPERRRRDRSGLLRIFEKLIGMDMKLRQYELGKQFCDAVAKAGGIAALNRVWEGPASMPTLAELEDPDAWMARTGPARAA